MVLRLGRFLARSTTSTSVPISGPSTVESEKMPAVCIPCRALSGWDFGLVVVILSVLVGARLAPYDPGSPCRRVAVSPCRGVDRNKGWEADCLLWIWSRGPFSSVPRQTPEEFKLGTKQKKSSRKEPQIDSDQQETKR